MRVMREVVEAHPLVLKDPEPVIRVHELGDSSVNFICRPWVRTADYWALYWDLHQQMKEAFDANGISIPFPQRDVHVYSASAAQALPPAPRSEPAPAAAPPQRHSAEPTKGFSQGDEGHDAPGEGGSEEK